MSNFHRATIVAATQVVGETHSHADLDVLEVQWGMNGTSGSSGKAARIARLARIAIEENPAVRTIDGETSLSRALVELAIQAPEQVEKTEAWRSFVAGLRFDGFEIDENLEATATGEALGTPTEQRVRTLRRMLPDDVPGLDFHEAENEIMRLLTSCGFVTAKGHLEQAMSAFQRGEWASANAQLRTFLESCLDDIAVKLGYGESGGSKDKRDYLGGKLQPPFLLENYNEWNKSSQKPQYVQGLISRLHPHGSHAGLSEGEDAAFRLQITLITARLFLRRHHQRENKNNE